MGCRPFSGFATKIIFMSTYYDEIACDPFYDYSIIIEDNGKVCYAYLIYKGDITGDVWLYNQIDAPTKVEWKREEMPFLNPKEFAKDVHVKPISQTDEISIECLYLNDTGLLQYVRIFV